MNIVSVITQMVVLFLLVSAIIVPLTWWLNRHEVER